MKLDCRQVQRMAGAFAEDELDDRDLASVLAHVRTCSSCYEELKTSYLITFALQYMDLDRSGSLDIDTLMDEKIRKSEQKLRIHRVLNVLLWMLIVFLAIVIAAIIMRIVLPDRIPFLTDLLNSILNRLADLR